MAVELDPDSIRTDGGTQPRAEINQEVINDYLQRMREGDCFPPVIVFFDGTDHWLADGFHRYHAAKQDIGRFVSAEVRKGTRRDAVLYSVGANATHGLRRTNDDKRRAVNTLLRDEEWSTWSDREIARRCYVDHKTVGAIKAELSLGKFPSEDNTPSDPQMKNYITKHGTIATMNTSNIGNDNLLQRWREQERWHQEADTPEGSPRLSEHEASLSGYRGQEKREEAWKWEHKANEKPERAHDLYPDRAYCPECDEWHREWEYPYGMKEGMWKCEECGAEIHSKDIKIKEGLTQRERYELASEMGTLDYYYKDLRQEAIAREEEDEEVEIEEKKEQRDAHVMRVMGSSDSPEWYTPPEIVEKVLELMGTIELDPCSNSHEDPKVPATIRYTKEDDGLSHEWKGKTYLNPPYGSVIGIWTNKLIEAYKAGDVEEAVALLPGRIDTNWFSPLYEYRICIIKGRVQFENSPHHAPFPCVLVYLGPRRDEFTKVFSPFGPIVERIA